MANPKLSQPPRGSLNSLQPMGCARDSAVRLPVRTFGAQFWLVDLSGTPSGVDLESLSADEQSRAARFVFDEHRRRFQLAHAALRMLLAEEIGVAPSRVEFLHGPHQKPALHDGFGCVFNMSHSDELALIAIARDLPPGAEIGVDIEALREVRNTGELAAMNFTTREQAELAEVAPRERNWYFLSGWTRKEACLKAVGSGLSITPQAFECALAPVRTLTRIPTPQGLRTVEVESVDVQDGHLGAIAITVPAADA